MNQDKSSFKYVFGRLITYMRPYRVGLILAMILIVVASFVNSIAPFLLGKATDALIGLVVDHKVSQEGVENFLTILIVLLGCYTIYGVLKYIGSLLTISVSQKTIFDIRNQVDEKQKKLPLNYFDTNSYGDVLSRITNDVDTISNTLQQSLEQIVTAVTTLITIFVMMLLISPVLTAIGVITVPLALFLSLKIANYSQKYFQAQQNTLGDINGYVEEMYTGHNLISVFGKEEDVITEFETTNRQLYKSGLMSQFLTSTLLPITQGMTNIGYVLVAVVSSLMVIGGQLSIGMIQSFIQYLRQFSQPINQTVQISSVLQSTVAAAVRIYEFLDAEEELPDPEPSTYPDKITGAVEFEHVKFGYLPYQYLMEDVSMTIKAGDKVAIVGPTGAGKTTLVNLLLRFYDIHTGAIKIDGVNIKDMERVKLREIYGMVLQDTWLFTGTIRENIRYGRLGSSDEEVEQAAQAAHADSFIKALPGGYDFVLNEGATNLAQGERQLLTIARAILSDAPIMILDEATSSVDTRTEVLIQKALVNLMNNRTSFVIAHRLSTIKDSDMIIYMQNGDIKETGTHEALIAAGGYYHALYQSQFAENA